MEKLTLPGSTPSRLCQWYHDNLALLAQRDLPNWGWPAGPHVTDRLLRMTDAVHGQIWNASQIGQALCITHPTVSSLLDYVEGAFLVRRLQPFAARTKKRLVKRPRLYWRDSGLLHAVLLHHGGSHIPPFNIGIRDSSSRSGRHGSARKISAF